MHRPWEHGNLEYRLVKRLAAGGMADLFLAQVWGPRGYERTVVVKTVRADAGPMGPLVHALHSEATMGLRLRHPNVVRLEDANLDSDRPHLVFEFIFGRDLAQVRDRIWAENRPVPLGVVMTVAREVLEALVHVHEGAGDVRGGAIHRDVSPQNILLGFDGQVKLADFGLAKADFLEGGTHTGMVKGKAAYLAPELLRGQEVTPRSDIFSLGVLLWELLCGRRLFFRHDDQESAGAVLQQTVPWPRHRERPIPFRMAWICWRATRKSLSWRYQSARAMRDALASADRRSRDERQAELADWMRGLFAERLFRRERHAASFQDPVQRRQILDAGFEMTPEVTETRAPAGGGGRPVLRTSRSWWPWAVVGLVAAGLVGERLLEARRVGWIRVTESSGSVQINGRLLSKPSSRPLMVAPGVHTVVLEVEGERREYGVWVMPGQEITVP